MLTERDSVERTERSHDASDSGALMRRAVISGTCRFCAESRFVDDVNVTISAFCLAIKARCNFSFPRVTWQTRTRLVRLCHCRLCTCFSRRARV